MNKYYDEVETTCGSSGNNTTESTPLNISYSCNITIPHLDRFELVDLADFSLQLQAKRASVFRMIGKKATG